MYTYQLKEDKGAKIQENNVQKHLDDTRFREGQKR